MESWLRALVRLILYFWLSITALLLGVVLFPFRAYGNILSISVSYNRFLLAVLGIKMVVRGAPVVDRPALFVANHSSYVDIGVLGALTRGYFIAKSEIRAWPLIGWMARLARTVFVERRQGTAVRGRDTLLERLCAGDQLILFAEGTTSDGNRVLPFKSSLFAVAWLMPPGIVLTVQPVSIIATHIGGLPLGYGQRPLFSWYGDMDLAPHLLRLMSLRGFTVIVEFHSPVTSDKFSGRKALAEYCRRVIADSVSQALCGATSPGGPQ